MLIDQSLNILRQIRSYMILTSNFHLLMIDTSNIGIDGHQLAMLAFALVNTEAKWPTHKKVAIKYALSKFSTYFRQTLAISRPLSIYKQGCMPRLFLQKKNAVRRIIQ
eukprot:GHVP01006933.1.p1 GENE.GHVP01006933.1~~GHVP01006933.1.p1  ORF type:complete len:108 (+),score=1.57 GHVP01006933.1:465-788(+)